MTAARREGSAAAGVTLLELLLVFTLLALAAALAAPAFLTPPEPPAAAVLGEPLRAARANAIRRAETLYLTVAAGGRWRLDAASDTTAPLATGVEDGYAGPGLTVVVSPLGTCGLDAASAAAGRSLDIDPLTCATGPP